MGYKRVGQIQSDTSKTTGQTFTWLLDQQRQLLADAKTLVGRCAAVEEREDEKAAYEAVDEAVAHLLAEIQPMPLPGSENELKTDKKARDDGAPDA